jgi:hypothetical protein
VTLLDENLEDVTLAMKPTVSLAGRMLLEASPASPLGAGALSIVARSKEPATFRELSVSPAPVAPDLTFTLRGLAGQMLLRPNGRLMNNWFLKAVLLGNQDITDVPTEFREEDSTHLQIVLTTRASEVGGTVTDDKGQPVANCNVVLFSEDMAGWFPWSSRFRTVRPDRDGHFTIKGLRSGRYYAIALPPERSFAAQAIDAATFESMVKDATVLVLGDEQQRQVDLKVAASGRD